MPDFNTPADIVMPVLGIALYTCLFVYALGVLYSTRYIQKLRKKGLKFDEWLPLFFLVLTVWYAALRIPWHMFKMVPSLLHDDTFILLRWILLFHNTSFILIAIEWTMLLHRASLKTKIDKKQLRMILFIIFGVVIGFIYVYTIVLFGVINGKREGNIHFEVNINLFTFLSLAIAILFIVYPARLLRMVHKSTSDRKKQQIRKLLTVSLLYLLCFFARAVGLMYRPITHSFMPNAVFWLITYWLPELIPTAYQCHLIHGKQLKLWKKRGSARSNSNVHHTSTGHHNNNNNNNSVQLTARRSSTTPHLDTEHNA